MTTIAEVEEILKENSEDGITGEEIAQETHDGDNYCSNCGERTTSFDQECFDVYRYLESLERKDAVVRKAEGFTLVDQ